MEPCRGGIFSADGLRAVVRYREYAPCEALRPFVRALFSFARPGEREAPEHRVIREVCFRAGDSFCAPLFADGHASIVFSFPRACRAGGVWEPYASDPHGEVIGPMTRVGWASLSERQEAVGAYLRAVSAWALMGVAASALTDRVVPLEDLWGVCASAAAERFNECTPEAERIGELESTLQRRIARVQDRSSAVDIARLAAWVVRNRGGVGVEELAASAGVSRQHLTRVFRKSVGVSPKRYCRLARFREALAYTDDPGQDWAQAALEMGYADQSHMIAEFRCFSSLTPEQLARGRWFHPFIERMRTARSACQAAIAVSEPACTKSHAGTVMLRG